MPPWVPRAPSSAGHASVANAAEHAKAAEDAGAASAIVPQQRGPASGPERLDGPLRRWIAASCALPAADLCARPDNALCPPCGGGASGAVPVYVRADDACAQRALGTLGWSVERGRWQLRDVWASELAVASLLPGAVTLRHAPRSWPLGHVSSEAIGLGAIEGGQRLRSAYRGRGVLVGLIDTGLDYRHPAFAGADGNTRVVAAWDQDATAGPAPSGFRYGTFCGAAALAEGRCPLSDDDGHGTHVAGVAVGGRRLAGGIADAADIAVVRSRDFTRLMDAVDFVFMTAAARGQPAVVNISVGAHYGPHDGLTPLEQALEAASGPGRIVVVAAGNEGNSPIHARLPLAPDAPVRMAFVASGAGRLALAGRAQAVAAPGDTPAAGALRPGPDALRVELWGDDGPEGPPIAHAQLEWWQNDRASRALPIATVDGDGRLRATAHPDGAPSPALAARWSWSRPGGGRMGLQLDVASVGDWPQDGFLALAARGHGTAHAWVVDGDGSSHRWRIAARGAPGFVDGDAAQTVAVPATAASVISVGSFGVQARWRDATGAVRQMPDVVPGALSAFSSRGPTPYPDATGPKPDLCAPGSVVASVRAWGSPRGRNLTAAGEVVMQGSSMAAPHVTGTVALMLEANPTLSPAAVRRALVQSAKRPGPDGARGEGAAGPAPDGWGAGRLDAPAALRCAERAPSPPPSCAAFPTGAPAGASVALVTWRRARRRGGTPLAV